MKKLKQLLKIEWYLVTLMFKTDVLLGTMYWAMVSVLRGIPLVNIWLWKLILDELTVIYQTKNSDDYIWMLVFSYLLLQVTASIIGNISSVVYNRLNQKASHMLDMQIMIRISEVDSEFFDNPKNSDMANAAQTSQTYISSNMTWAVNTIIRIIVFISALIMFLSYNPIFGLLYIFTYIPGAIISYKNKAKIDQWSIDNIPQNRKKNYYKSLLTQSFAAKDLRLYNLAGYFKSKYNQLWNEIRNKRAILFKKGAMMSFLASLLTYGGIVVIFILSVQNVLAGVMLIGTLSLYIGLAQSSGENFKSIITSLATQIEIDLPHVINYIDFINYENKIKDNGTENILECPTVEFRNIYFKYPNHDENVLNNLCFKIESGKKIALIGINGAGKTTIVKLLLRFYEPTSGDILLNGRDIKEYSLQELHKTFSVCFQDINKYSLTFKENIALSDINKITEFELLNEAVEASGIHEIYENLPNGYDTEMTRNFDNEGVELSGGQWQKVAIARTFFKISNFIILDEPSSALDPEAEDHVLASFKKMCKNKGGIIISHRLSSILMVDEILLIENGSIVETGTHDDLIAQNGKYATLYHMQADKYKGRGN